MGRSLFFRPIPCVRNKLNTDAESVDDIVAASNIDTMRESCMSIADHSESAYIKAPVSAVVIITPNVESNIPGPMIGFISLNLVSMPPENRMTLSAIIPMNWASAGLLKYRPRPSLPKAMPVKRNSKSVGMPKR